MNESKEIRLDATIENIAVVTDFVDAELEERNCPTKAKMQIDIAIDELFGNIANYAYDKPPGEATVRIEITDDPIEVIITFMDKGVPYDPLTNEDPDTSLPASQRKIGGLGIFIVKQSMDSVEYEYKDGSNVLRIRKNISG